MEMLSKLIGGIFLVTIFSLTAFAQSHQEDVKFSMYPAKVYKGQISIPSYYVRSEGVWRDELGKQTAPPAINFGGKYFVGLHSCGTDCRYYTLTDLSTGKNLNSLDIFSSDGEKPSKTKDGRTYVTDLVTRANSMLVVAQYHVNEGFRNPAECRQRFFLFDSNAKKLDPVTGTINHCGIQ